MNLSTITMYFYDAVDFNRHHFLRKDLSKDAKLFIWSHLSPSASFQLLKKTPKKINIIEFEVCVIEI